MRRAVIAGLVVVAGLVLVWKLACNSSSTSVDPSAPSGTAGGPNGGSGATRIVRASAQPASLSGRVTKKAGGDPIAGAIVAVVSTTTSSRIPGMANETPSTLATTDKTGAWKITAIPPGAYKVTATAVGFLSETSDKLVVAPNETKDHIDLSLAEGGTLVSGTVTDVGGGPIGGARVTMQPGGVRWSRGANSEVVAVTADDGTYKLSLADGDWTANVTHEDYTHALKWFRMTGVALTMDFTLVPGAVIRGQVITKDGKPVPGAVVSSHAERRRFESVSRATADDEGKFVLKAIGTGAISLTASARGYASKSPTTITVGIGENVDNVKIIVDHAFSISGTVVDASTKKGIAGIKVNGFSMATSVAASSDPTGDDGAFEITGVGPGTYMLFATGDGVMPEFGKSAEVVDKDITGITIEMGVGITLSGRVEPAVAASIRLEPDMDKINISNAMTASKAFAVSGDSDPSTGAFVLKNVPNGEFSLVATHSDGRTGKIVVNIADKDQQNLVVMLEPRASIAGKVMDGNGKPVSGVKVTAEATGEGTSARTRMMFGAGRDAVVTGPDGAFKLVGLDAGKLDMVVRDEQGKLTPAKGDKLASVDVAKGQDVTGVLLTVEARDGKITGKVVGADGKPTTDAWVTATVEATKGDMEARISRAFGQVMPVLTNSDGRFAIDKLRHGTYQLIVDGPKGTSRAEATAKAGDDVTITLVQLGSLSGKVMSNGSIVKTYDVECRLSSTKGFVMPGSNEQLDQHVAADDGVYAFDRVAPGSYACTIASDSGTAKDTVVIAADPVSHDFTLVPFASVTGIVVDAVSGKPLKDVLVFNPTANSQKQLSAMLAGGGPRTDVNGKFELTNQPLGEARLVLFNGAKPLLATPGSSSLSINLTAGQHLDLGTIRVNEGTFGGSGSAVP